jgi:apolipoprotein D and lipocalin family protein
MRLSFLLLLLILAGCTGIPDGIEPVEDFNVERYLGTWYEIARLDHRFERGLTKVTARYTLRDDGGIDVVNRGYRADDGTWEQAEGRAYFIADADIGRLKVSFFGPFYGAYNVFELDEDYQHALVAGPNRSYLWILARQPELAPATLDQLKERIADAGYDPSELIMVEHHGRR